MNEQNDCEAGKQENLEHSEGFLSSEIRFSNG